MKESKVKTCSYVKDDGINMHDFSLAKNQGRSQDLKDLNHRRLKLNFFFFHLKNPNYMIRGGVTLLLFLGGTILVIGYSPPKKLEPALPIISKISS